MPDNATLVLAQSARDGAWEHAAWRRASRPFIGYADRLRAFGCEFGTVPTAEFADFIPATCIARYSLRRAGQGGSVSFYHEWRKPVQQPSSWYVSVVWRTRLDPTHASPDPTHASPEQAEPAVFDFPPRQVTAGETVLALREAALAVAEALDGPHCHHEPTFPQWLYGRLAPWMVRMRLPLAHDDAGYLYAPDVRQAIASLDADHVIGVEALLALRTVATVLDPLFHNLRSAELVEGTARLDRTVEGIGADQLIDLRDALRHIVSRRHAPPATP